MTAKTLSPVPTCACRVPAWDIANESLCMDKGNYVVWMQCKRCRKATWVALLMLADSDE